MRKFCLNVYIGEKVLKNGRRHLEWQCLRALAWKTPSNQATSWVTEIFKLHELTEILTYQVSVAKTKVQKLTAPLRGCAGCEWGEAGDGRGHSSLEAMEPGQSKGKEELCFSSI